ncbi:MAG: HU family DNA-binding protein [Actinomycetota bacterium]|nr:HU family DNA-binding protein [Actinomycetota bacterium]
MAGKTELVESVAQDTGMPRADVTRVIDSTLAQLRSSLDAGDSVTLRGFGVFKVIETAARKGRNPATGEMIDIPAGRRISFKPAR